MSPSVHSTAKPSHEVMCMGMTPSVHSNVKPSHTVMCMGMPPYKMHGTAKPSHTVMRMVMPPYKVHSTLKPSHTLMCMGMPPSVHSNVKPSHTVMRMGMPPYKVHSTAKPSHTVMLLVMPPSMHSNVKPSHKVMRMGKPPYKVEQDGIAASVSSIVSLLLMLGVLLGTPVTAQLGVRLGKPVTTQLGVLLGTPVTAQLSEHYNNKRASSDREAYVVAPKYECNPNCTALGNCNLDRGMCDCPFGRSGPDCQHLLLPACRLENHPTAVMSCEEQQLSNVPTANDTGVDYYQTYLSDLDENITTYNELMSTYIRTSGDRTFRCVPLEHCPKRCNGRGTCITLDVMNRTIGDYACRCYKGYNGKSCRSVYKTTSVRATANFISCLLDCSGRGTCVYGFCHCKPGYFGLGCTRSSSPLAVDRQNRGGQGPEALGIPNLLDHFSIRLTSEEIPNLLDHLNAVSPSKLISMYESLAKHHRAFLWPADLGGAAYELTISSIYDRVKSRVQNYGCTRSSCHLRSKNETVFAA
eukprot:gene32785-33850_t